MARYEIYQSNNTAVESALLSAGLTPLQRYVFGRFMDGLRQREVAQEIGTSQPFVSRQIKIAIKKIRSVTKRFTHQSI
jgi:DNA-binding CsgD family transcriptional regulator